MGGDWNMIQEFDDEEEEAIYREELSKIPANSGLSLKVKKELAKTSAKMKFHNQRMANKQTPQNYSYPQPVQPVPFQMIPGNARVLSRVMNPIEAGLSFEDAQAENYRRMQDQRELGRKNIEISQELYKRRNEYAIDREHTELSNEEEERHTRVMNEIAHENNYLQSSFTIGADSNQNGNNSSIVSNLYDKDGNLNYENWAKWFIQEKQVFIERLRRETTEANVYLWDDTEKIYRKMTVSSLKDAFCEFIYNNVKNLDTSIADSKISNLATAIRVRLAQEITKSQLQIANGNQTFFMNGYYDVKIGKFYSGDTKDWFHVFCVPYNYDENAPEPEKFNEVLNLIFNGDQEKIALFYQILGALLSDVRNLKYIYVFQGKTNTGKTTVSSLMLKMLDKHEILKINNVTEITGDKIKNMAKSVKIVCVKDTGQAALTMDTATALKSYASGDFDEDDIYFKILIQTNNAIYGDKSGYIPSSLANRFIVLPFERFDDSLESDKWNAVVEHFIENEFENERPAIFKRALEAVHQVIVNNRRFQFSFPLNGCVESSTDNLKDKNVSSIKWDNQRLDLLKGVIKAKFDFVNTGDFLDNPRLGIEPKEVLAMINSANPNLIANTSVLGKKLKEVFPDSFSSKELPDKTKTYYNLKSKIRTDGTDEIF